MFTITKEFAFSASHVLDRLPGWHPCARMHGHNYVVVFELSAHAEELTDAGFVRDYRDLDPVKKWIDVTLDHRHLNEAMGGGCLPVGRESRPMGIRGVAGTIPGAVRSARLRDPQDLGGVPPADDR